MKNHLFLFKEMINLAMNIHTQYAKQENNLVRKHDKFTPYFLHPVSCAGMAMEDDNDISIKDRFIIASALLFHDVLEDTTVTDRQLTSYLEEIFQKHYDENLEKLIGPKDKAIVEIIDLVKQATTIGGSKKEYEYLKANEDKISEELWYLKLIDKYFNILGSRKRLTQNGNWDFYKGFLYYLAEKTSKTRFKNSIWIKTVRCIE